MNNIPKPKVESKFPQCVSMQLHIQAANKFVQNVFHFRIKNLDKTEYPKQLDLHLTINFNGEQEIEIPGGVHLGFPKGHAKFGVKCGQLKFQLTNCRLPLENVSLFPPFQVSIPIEQQESRSQELQVVATQTAMGITPKLSKSFSQKSNINLGQVRYIGTETMPVWLFTTYSEHFILEGMLKEELLGRLVVDQLPCEIIVEFIVEAENIRITWGEMGLAKKIHRNKMAVIERFLILRHIKPLIQESSICKGEWKYG